jgi:hypothetical protein
VRRIDDRTQPLIALMRFHLSAIANLAFEVLEDSAAAVL